MPFFKTTPSGLRIIVVGAGKVGTTLVEQFSQEGHDITVIDKDPKKIREITSAFDVMGYTGNGASYTTLKEAGADTSDLLIAVTDSDELNLLCCTIAKQFSKCAAISRVRTPDYSKEAGYLREKLGLAMIINPDLVAARVMSRILYMPSALEINSFAHGQAEIIKLKIPNDNILNKMTIARLGADITNNILICGVERDGKVMIPGGNFELSSGDIISVVGSRKELSAFFKKIGFDTHQVKNAMIIGGGRSSYYLASILLKSGIEVKIIESDQNRCNFLSEFLPKAVVINGDGTNTELLSEEGIEKTEAFIPLTGMDEQNVMLSLHAKKVSSAKVITKINRIGFNDIVANLDLGSVIYPKYITTETIIAYVRAKKASSGSNIETLYHLFDARAEAIEFKVTEENALTGIPLKELKLKDNLLIAFIGHNGEAIIPRGDSVILPGDSVMIVTTHSGFNEITDILR